MIRCRRWSTRQWLAFVRLRYRQLSAYRSTAPVSWTSTQYIEPFGTTCYAHFCFALATLGAWVGGATGRVAKWPGAVLTPGYLATLGTAASAVAGVGIGFNLAAAWIGGLDPWPSDDHRDVGIFGLPSCGLRASGASSPCLPGHGCYDPARACLRARCPDAPGFDLTPGVVRCSGFGDGLLVGAVRIHVADPPPCEATAGGSRVALGHGRGAIPSAATVGAVDP